MVQTYLTPLGIVPGQVGIETAAAGKAWPFLGDQGGFTALKVSTRDGARVSHRVAVWPEPAVRVDPVMKVRPPFATLDMSRPRIMGVLNVTPDSFFDGGRFAAVEQAIAHGIAMLEAGADIIDVGGESTRPGAVPVTADEDARRVVPVIKALAERGVCVSVDTRHGAVMSAAIAAGAGIVNDVTALTGDPASLDAVARSRASVILMHMQGEPRTMQANPTYVWAPGDVFDVLAGRIAACEAAGIPRSRIAVDPGIGFGKTADHSTDVLRHLAMYHGLGCPLAVGASRKSFIGKLSRGEDTDHRLPGSLAVAIHAVNQGVQIVRVHDVAETRQALAVAGRLAERT
jgi:dihydropteroate synthase